LKVKLGGRVVNKRQKVRLKEAGMGVLSRREQVGPNLIHADPVQTGRKP
jgi:hypothetical protein